MGVRGEIFSTKVAFQNRTYFFNVKENRMGDLFLNIVESKNRESGGFERQSIILFAEDLGEFLTGFDESLRVMEKAGREKRKDEKPAKTFRPETPGRPESSRRTENASKPREYKPREHKPREYKPRESKPREYKPRERTRDGERSKPWAGRKSSPESPGKSAGNSPYSKPKRRVVKKKDY